MWHVHSMSTGLQQPPAWFSHHWSGYMPHHWSGYMLLLTIFVNIWGGLPCCLHAVYKHDSVRAHGRQRARWDGCSSSSSSALVSRLTTVAAAPTAETSILPRRTPCDLLARWVLPRARLLKTWVGTRRHPADGQHTRSANVARQTRLQRPGVVKRWCALWSHQAGEFARAGPVFASFWARVDDK